MKFSAYSATFRHPFTRITPDRPPSTTMNTSLLRPLRPLAAALALCAFSAVAQAPGDVRVALVIGNASYTGAPLLNPANDAKAMSGALRGLGFTVIEVRDGSKAQMADAIAKVRDTLKGKQGVGMMYYAGHGLQMDARNFMVPVDAKLSKAGDVPAQTVEVGSVIEAFRAAGNRMNILVLDACRDNPFGGITTGKGLAPLDAPSGTFLAYATAPGNVAGDGDAKSGNGLYTQYLLEELKKPQASIENVFKRVRFSVRKASGGRQIPWESTSLEDDFQFNDGKIVAAVKPTTQQIQSSFSQEKADWERISASTSVDDFFAFLQKYPNGTISEAAHARLNFLQKPAIKVQEQGGMEQSYAAAKYRMGDVFEQKMTMRGIAGVPAMTIVHQVVKVEPDRIEVMLKYPGTPGVPDTLQVMDGTGGLKSVGDSARFDPPQYTVPGGLLQVGKTWTSAYQVTYAPAMNTPARMMTMEGRIVARERVTVAAGTFDAFRMEVGGRAVDSRGEQPSPAVVLWMSPDIPMPVKMEATIKVPGVTSVSVTELSRVVRAN